jgi:hypothetical protein
LKLSLRRWFFVVLCAIPVFFLLIQLIPYGRTLTNPAPVTEPEWNSPRTRELVESACYDCHSNQTTWPWYAKVAPASWLVYTNVTDARKTLNFNELKPGQGEQMVDKMVRLVETADMPPFMYQTVHPAPRFSSAERLAVINGLLATFQK